MKIIGLTGSIGMGKSVTSSLLRLLKIPVHDSDEAVHTTLGPQGAAVQEVGKIFPGSFDRAAHAIDRAKLGKIVFGDADKLRQLEAILHPHVWHSQNKFVRKARAAGFKAVVLDIPLLFETGADRKCDLVIVVTTPYFLQRQRVLKRRNMSEARFQSILKSQIPDHEKRKRADFVIDTGLGRRSTLQALKKLLKDIL